MSKKALITGITGQDGSSTVNSTTYFSIADSP